MNELISKRALAFCVSQYEIMYVLESTSFMCFYVDLGTVLCIRTCGATMEQIPCANVGYVGKLHQHAADNAYASKALRH